ncbi:tld [Symbiodinium pilosum]|uniref:Metalloendopeptidase n=1 Tax=Symbiodinium pilosum TaxID=2952 RepID=A0A812NRC6_SYMPI|nr:tld [Symbiodinium pilosum]
MARSVLRNPAALLLIAALAKSREATREDPTTTSKTTTTTPTTTTTTTTTTTPRNHAPAWLGAAWVASSFSDCTQCSFGSVQIREVKCVAVFENALLPPEICENLPAPPTTKDCDCSVLPCNSALASKCPSQATCTSPDDMDRYFVELGCFKRVDGHEGPGRQGKTAIDWSCMDYDGKLPCKSGLPFYSMHSNAMSPSLCYDFCTSKGLDIFALVDESECRCGVSSANRNLRHRGDGNPLLHFQVAVLEHAEPDKGLCPLRAYRYVGHFEAGGLPVSMVSALAGDIEYVDSVIAGHQQTAAEEDIGAPPAHRHMEKTPVGHKMRDLQDDAPEQLPWSRACYPHNCAVGSGPWEDRIEEVPAGVNDIWKDYVIIPYVFDHGVDNARKEAFRSAVVRWHEGTCVVLKEVLQIHINQPYIKVGIYDEDSCWCQGQGYPGYWHGRPQAVLINLGWCNSIFYVGSMVHEIGHALGMNHEHKRPDAYDELHGHGPHIVVHWENIERNWRSQYIEEPNTYTGSNYQGAGDSYHGYAPYDYESIMHYPLTDAFDPVEPGVAGLLGNRDYLSEGDLFQVNDMYQCKEKSVPAVTLRCAFEVDLCDWKDVGSAAAAKWSVHAEDSGAGPARGAGESLGYAWAEVLKHPQKAIILQSPFLDITKHYKLQFSYYASAGKLEVDFQDALGMTKKLWDSTNATQDWKLQELTVAGALAVRFVAIANQSEASQAAHAAHLGVGLDEVDIMDTHGGDEATMANVQGSTETSSKGAFAEIVAWFRGILDTLFAKKYDDARSRALRSRLHGRGSSILPISLVVLSIAAVTISLIRLRARTAPAASGFMLVTGE